MSRKNRPLLDAAAAMMNAALRKSLSQDLRRLVTGRMTNDAFDDIYYQTYGDSHDGAVEEIAGFGYSLYSSDRLLPYRLRGPDAVSAESRAIAARCVLFLRSGLAYQWPPLPESQGLLGAAALIGLLLGIALSYFWLLIFSYGWDHEGGFYAVLGTLILAASIACIFYKRRLIDEERRFYKAGDFDVWPFLCRPDFNKARNSAYLLGRTQ